MDLITFYLNYPNQYLKVKPLSYQDKFDEFSAFAPDME